MKIDKAAKGHPDADTSPIAFRLDPRSGVPTYLQIVQQVQQALRLGHLQIGDQLPRVKDVVASLSINPNTVLKAYRDLENKGTISGRPGQGTFVDVAPETVGLEVLATLRRSLTKGWLAEASAAGLDDDGIVALFTSALRDFHEKPAAIGAHHQPRRREGKGVA
jgi:GntR family transcriptional regulator